MGRPKRDDGWPNCCTANCGPRGGPQACPIPGVLLPWTTSGPYGGQKGVIGWEVWLTLNSQLSPAGLPTPTAPELSPAQQRRVQRILAHVIRAGQPQALDQWSAWGYPRPRWGEQFCPESARPPPGLDRPSGTGTERLCSFPSPAITRDEKKKGLTSPLPLALGHLQNSI